MKRLIRPLLLLCMLLSLFGVLASASAARESTVYVRKHVSILYDNSGSMKERLQGMKNLKWCYASYAAQVFTGLLNETDTLSVTLMSGDQLIDLDLHGLRQDTVDTILEHTSTAGGETPVTQIGAALAVLENEGLRPGLGENAAGEQYWLVLTTDGVFRENGENLSAERVASELEAIMKRFPDLHMVYFGIGTKNDNSDSKAVDFRPESKLDKALLDRLNSCPNFTPVYAESQDDIVSTMKSLSNRISGRYDIPEEYEVSGQQLRLYLSGEGSPIRNIALMAQETNARLLSAVSEDGAELTILREAQIVYPVNPYYDNVDDGTLGGYVALIAGPSGEKVPAGSIILSFSEPVDAGSISMMYEPAVHIRLLVERQTADGLWESVPEFADLVEGDEIRIGYLVCEDGSDRELDTSRLFGETEARILYDGSPVESGQVMTVSPGEYLLDIQVSMMDGGYQIGTSRILRVGLPTAEDITVGSSGPIELFRREAAENTEQYVEFTLLFRNAPVDAAYAAKAALLVTGDSGELKGRVENPSPHVFRFTPHDDACRAGEYTVHLYYDGEEAASERIRILPNEPTYTAQAGPGISIMSNHTADNDAAVTFQVTAHRDEADGPIDAGEAALFTVRAEGSGGEVSGITGWRDGGVIAFTLQDPAASPGDYRISLWKGDEKLAETFVTVLRHDAVYTVEAVVPDPGTVDRFQLHANTACIAFIVYEDGVPCPPEQLEAMLTGGHLTVSTDLSSRCARIERRVGQQQGSPALICTPVSTAKNAFIRFFHYLAVSIGMTGLNRDSFRISAKVDMLHGDEASGVLELVGYETVYLIAAVCILAVIVLFLLFLLANARAVRMKKGVLWSCELTVPSDNVGGVKYMIGSVKYLHVGRKLRLMLLPRNEKHSFRSLTFFAAASSQQSALRQSKWFRTSNPSVTVEGAAEQVRRFRYHLPMDSRTELLNRIKGFHQLELSTTQFRLLTDAAVSLLPKGQGSDQAQQKSEVTVALQNGFILFKAMDHAKPPKYTFWWYSADTGHSDRPGKRRQKQGKRSPKRGSPKAKNSPPRRGRR